METRVYELVELGDYIPSAPIRQAISLGREGNVTYTHTHKLLIRIGGDAKQIYSVRLLRLSQWC